MIIPIIIPNISLEFLDAKDVKTILWQTVRIVEANIHANIISTAEKKLTGKRLADYVKSIKRFDSDNEMTKTIQLVGSTANNVEYGSPPYDMKIGFANSKKAKRTGENKTGFEAGRTMKYEEKGWYLTIPFRIGTPKTVSFGSVMPQDIYTKLALKLKPSVQTEQGGKIEWGDKITLGQLKNLGKGYEKKGVSKGYGDWKPYTHTSAEFEGLVNIQHEYKKDTQGFYMKFRRVSSKSNANSWIHPGFKAVNIFDEAVKDTNTDDIFDKVLNDFLKQ